MHPNLRVWKAEDGQWYWHVTAINGNILSRGSEGYETKAGSQQGFVDTTEAHLRACGIPEHKVERYARDLKQRLSFDMNVDGPDQFSMILKKSF